MVSMWQMKAPSDEEKAALVKIYDEAAWKHYSFITQLADKDQDLLHGLNEAVLNPTVAFGEVWVAGETEGGEPGAVCTVSPPGVGFWETPEEKAMGLNQTMARMSPEHVHWFENHVMPLLALEHTVYPDPSTAHESYYIVFIATSPAHQGKGYAKALLKSVEDRARKEGRVVTLLTHGDWREKLYKSVGFRTQHRTEVTYRDGSKEGWYLMINDCKA